MFLFFFECGQPRTWCPGHALDYEQSHRTSRSRARVRRATKLRGTRAEAQVRAPQSIHLKTINLHNFTFSLAVRGSYGLGLPRRGTGRHDTKSIKRLRADSVSLRKKKQRSDSSWEFLKMEYDEQIKTLQNNSWPCVAFTRTHFDLFFFSFFSKTSANARERAQSARKKNKERQ